MVINNQGISVHIKDLTKKFGDFTAVNKISLDVKRGEIFGFLGANGAGKTTAMRMLCGLSHCTSGEGTVAGFDINTQQEKIKRNIGYMSQKFSLYEDLTVFENIIIRKLFFWMSQRVELILLQEEVSGILFTKLRKMGLLCLLQLIIWMRLNIVIEYLLWLMAGLWL